MVELTRGTQVIYIPNHMKLDKNKPASAENCKVDITQPESWSQYNGIVPGFISSVAMIPENVFVRLWQTWPGGWEDPIEWDLSNKGGGQLTAVFNLVEFDTVSQQKVEFALEKYCQFGGSQ